MCVCVCVCVCVDQYKILISVTLCNNVRIQNNTNSYLFYCLTQGQIETIRGPKHLKDFDDPIYM